MNIWWQPFTLLCAHRVCAQRPCIKQIRMHIRLEHCELLAAKRLHSRCSDSSQWYCWMLNISMYFFTSENQSCKISEGFQFDLFLAKLGFVRNLFEGALERVYGKWPQYLAQLFDVAFSSLSTIFRIQIDDKFCESQCLSSHPIYGTVLDSWTEHPYMLEHLM